MQRVVVWERLDVVLQEHYRQPEMNVAARTDEVATAKALKLGFDAGLLQQTVLRMLA
jgi:hypothetical protein